MMRVADWIIDRLSLEVFIIFSSTSGSAMHLNDALALVTITPIVCQHEQACGIWQAYGRVGKSPVALP